jgi:hypothetical protein
MNPLTESFRRTFHSAALACLSVMTLGVMGCSDDEAGSAGASGESMSSEQFYAGLQSSDNYVPMTLDVMVEGASNVVLGRMVGVEEGVTIHYSGANYDDTVKTIVVELEADEILAGTSETLYIGFPYFGRWPGLDSLKGALPSQSMAVFVEPATWLEPDPNGDPEGVEFINPGAGHPPGTVLTGLRTPQALVIEGDGEVLQPLEPGGEQLFLPSVATLADVATAISGVMDGT